MDISDAIDRLKALGFESAGGYSESAIAEFESKRAVKLPPEYRQFLLEYGDANNPKCDGYGAAFAAPELSPLGRTLWIDDFSTVDQAYTPDGYFTIGTAVNWELGDSSSQSNPVGRARVLLKGAPPDFGAVYLFDVWISANESANQLLYREGRPPLPEIEKFVEARRLGQLPVKPPSEEDIYRLADSFLDLMQSINDTWASLELADRINESEWLACDSLARLNKHLMDRRGYTSFRHRHHFMAACLRRIGHLMTDERFHRAVDVVERLCTDDWKTATAELPAVHEAVERAASQFTNKDVAREEGEVSDEELGRAIDLDACRKAAAAKGENSAWVDPRHALWVAGKGLRAAAWATSDHMLLTEKESRYVAWSLNQRFGSQTANLFREVVGNPFRRAFSRHAFEKANRGERVANLVRSIYSERRFDRMPELADALEEAGCRDAEILAHCRSDVAHVRGCWVLELLFEPVL